MPEQARIIKADLRDAAHREAVVSLVDQYARQAPGGRPLTPAARDALPDGLRTHPSAVVFLAFQGDAAVGVAVCFRLFSTFAARPLLNIHDIAVDETHRGRGIGTQLLEAVEQEARASGCSKVTLEVRADNPAAERLYRRFGFGEPGGAGTRFLDKPLL